jgi:hypothetical protein
MSVVQTWSWTRCGRAELNCSNGIQVCPRPLSYGLKKNYITFGTHHEAVWARDEARTTSIMLVTNS